MQRSENATTPSRGGRGRGGSGWRSSRRGKGVKRKFEAKAPTGETPLDTFFQGVLDKNTEQKTGNRSLFRDADGLGPMYVLRAIEEAASSALDDFYTYFGLFSPSELQNTNIQTTTNTNPNEGKSGQTEEKRKRTFTPQIFLHPLTRSYPFFFDSIRPQFIILYDIDLKVIREIEMYKSRHPGMLREKSRLMMI